MILVTGALVVCGLVLLLMIIHYNRLVASRNLVQTAFSDIDVHLTKRFHLVPNLVQLTESYAAYESDLLLKIVQERAGKQNENDAETAQNDAQLSCSLQQLKLTVEGYPDLKANDQFGQLMEELTQIEDHLSYARRFYNGTTREYNKRVQSFPSNIVAGLFGFRNTAFYEVGDPQERNVPTYE